MVFPNMLMVGYQPLHIVEIIFINSQVGKTSYVSLCQLLIEEFLKDNIFCSPLNKAMQRDYKS